MTTFSVDTFCDRCARPIRSRNHIGTLCTHCGPEQPVGEMPEGIVRTVRAIDARTQALNEIRVLADKPLIRRADLLDVFERWGL